MNLPPTLIEATTAYLARTGQSKSQLARRLGYSSSWLNMVLLKGSASAEAVEDLAQFLRAQGVDVPPLEPAPLQVRSSRPNQLSWRWAVQGEVLRRPDAIQARWPMEAAQRAAEILLEEGELGQERTVTVWESDGQGPMTRYTVRPSVAVTLAR